jgi:hypothetical protein
MCLPGVVIGVLTQNHDSDPFQWREFKRTKHICLVWKYSELSPLVRKKCFQFRQPASDCGLLEDLSPTCR